MPDPDFSKHLHSLVHDLLRYHDALEKSLRGRFCEDIESLWLQTKPLQRGKPLFQLVEDNWESGTIKSSELFEITVVALREFEFQGNTLDNYLGIFRTNQPYDLRVGTVNITETIFELIDIYQHVAAEKGVQIRVELSLPEDIQGDRHLLRRMFMNILDNAIKYSFATGEMGQRRFVSIRGRRHSKEGHQLIEVENLGVGMLQEEIDSGSLLEFGVRGSEASDRQREGSGIGLAEADKIIRAHGGNLKLRSSRQKDAYLNTVQIVLPRRPLIS